MDDELRYEFKIEKGCGRSIRIFRKVVFPGLWDWKIKTKGCTSGLYQLPSQEFWMEIT